MQKNKVFEKIIIKDKSVKPIIKIHNKNSTINSYFVHRDDIYTFIDIMNLEKLTSLYFLLGIIDNKKYIYIGQSRNSLNRVIDHKSNKNFWDYVIFFSKKDDTFELIDIDYLEYYFINNISEKGFANLINADLRENEPIIDISNKIVIEQYIEDINDIIYNSFLFIFLFFEDNTELFLKSYFTNKKSEDVNSYIDTIDYINYNKIEEDIKNKYKNYKTKT